MSMPPDTITRDKAGRITGTRDFTLLEKEFLRHMVSNGLEPTEAAKLAGYANPPQAAWRLMQKTTVRDAVRAEISRLLDCDLAKLSVGIVRRILKDEDAPLKLRLDAAKTALDRAGFVAPKAREQVDKGDKDLSEMSVSELQAQLDDLKAQRAANAQPIIDNPTKHPVVDVDST